MTVSQEVIKKLHDEYAMHAISIFNEGNEVCPQCFVISLDDDGNVADIVATPPEMMAMFFGSQRGKDVFAMYLKDLLDDTSGVHQATKITLGFAPMVLVQINEAWLRFADKDDLDETPPSKHPDRQEAILVSIHTRANTTINHHKILDKPKRHAVFQELKMDQYIVVAGRFTMQDAFGSRDNPVH